MIQASLNYWSWIVFAPLFPNFAFIWDGTLIGATATKAIRNDMLICDAVFFVVYFLLIEPLRNHGLWLALTLLMISRGLFLTILALSRVYARI